ncbi:MAG: hypothetical protein ACOC01_04150 [Bacteroidales bacterium]
MILVLDAGKIPFFVKLFQKTEHKIMSFSSDCPAAVCMHPIFQKQEFFVEMVYGGACRFL